MADLSELERRRARRQQRILASKESRLSKITGTQSALLRETTPSPSPSPSTSTSSLPSSQPAKVKPQKHRPIVQKLIEEEQAHELNEKGFLGGKIPGLLLAGMLRKTSSRPRQSSNPINKYWNLLHFVCMLWLGTLAMYEFVKSHELTKVPAFFKKPIDHDIVHYPVFWYFVTLEIVLYFGRSIYQPGYYDQAETAGINLSNQLPVILQKPASAILKHGNVFTRVYRDLFVVIFVIGFSSLCISLFFV